jgi:Flp pilus assembly protein TadG
MSKFKPDIARGSRGFLRIRTIRRLAREENGATAVEFGLIAFPFFGLMMAIIETALVFFASQTLETAASDSARLILTGQAQSAGMTAAKFKEAACTRIFALFNCAAELRVDVRTYTTFNDLKTGNSNKLTDANGKLIENFAFQPGTASQVVSVRLIYPFPVIVTKFFDFGLGNMAEGKRLLVATVAFRNEPFGTN